MNTVHQPPVSDEPPGPHITPYFTILFERLEALAAGRGLPPEPWTA